MTPRIGEPRLYVVAADVVIYPGEVARALLSPHDLLRMANGEAVQPQQWMVEPEPGRRAAWLRIRYRLWDRFVNRLIGGRQRRDVSVTTEARE